MRSRSRSCVSAARRSRSGLIARPTVVWHVVIDQGGSAQNAASERWSQRRFVAGLASPYISARRATSSSGREGVPGMGLYAASCITSTSPSP